MGTRMVRCFQSLILGLALISIASPALAVEKQSPEAKVAAVNGVAISRADFDLEMRRTEMRLLRSGRAPSTPELSKIRMEVLDGLIARQLLYQESQKMGFKADPVAVNKQIEAIKKRFPSEDEFKSALSSMNFTEASLRSQLERDLAVKQLIDAELGQKITVSEEEMKAYYGNHPEAFKKPEQVKASHILIKVEAQADESHKAGARKKLKMIRNKLQEGKDFGSLAKEYSEGPSNTRGGDLGYFSRGQMVKPFEEAAFALKPGEVSGIVETRFGYHLIKVTDKTTEATMAYEEIQERLREFLKQQKLQKEMSLYVEGLKRKAKVETFLQEDPQ